MSRTSIAALLLIVLGGLGLAYGSFTYTRDTSTTELGPIEVTLSDRETVNVPIWLGVALLVGGGLLLVLPAKK
jgi:TRAP-type C4-dicarboxylate transport system permease small subunit